MKVVLDLVLDPVQLVVGLLAVTATYKVVTLARGFIPAQAALAGVFVALTAGVAPFAGVLTSVLGDTAAVRGWGDVIARACVALAAGMAQTYLLLLALPAVQARPRVRARLLLAVGVAAGLVVLGLVTPTRAFGSAPLDAWAEVAMHAVFLGYVAVTLADVANSSARWAAASIGSMRLGLGLVATGASCGIVYTVAKGAGVTVEAVGGDPWTWLSESGRATALLGLTLVSVGCVLPGLARGGRTVHHTLRSHLMLDRLYPLWADLASVTPGIALEPVQPRWRDRLHLRDLDLRLYRRVIEIRDGQLALRQMASPRIDALPDPSLALRLTAPDDVRGSDRRALPSTVDDEIACWAEIAKAYNHPGRSRHRLTL